MLGNQGKHQSNTDCGQDTVHRLAKSLQRFGYESRDGKGSGSPPIAGCVEMATSQFGGSREEREGLPTATRDFQVGKMVCVLAGPEFDVLEPATAGDRQLALQGTEAGNSRGRYPERVSQGVG